MANLVAREWQDWHEIRELCTVCLHLDLDDFDFDYDYDYSYDLRGVGLAYVHCVDTNYALQIDYEHYVENEYYVLLV